MTKIFLDSNIFLRLFLRDDEDHYQQTIRLFSLINEGTVQPYTSTIVALEVNYVLKSFYRLSLEKTLHYIDQMRSVRNITLIEITDFEKALQWYKHYKIKFSDCLIASQLRRDITLVTFDEEVKKIKGITVFSPQEFLSQIATN